MLLRVFQYGFRISLLAFTSFFVSVVLLFCVLCGQFYKDILIQLRRLEQRNLLSHYFHGGNRRTKERINERGTNEQVNEEGKKERTSESE